MIVARSEEGLIEAALSLPVDARARLVETLLRSLNSPSRKDYDQAWAKEAERRIDDLKSHQVEAIPGDEVFSRIRALK